MHQEFTGCVQPVPHDTDAVLSTARTHAQRAPDGRKQGEVAKGTQPSNTVPSKYIPEDNSVCRVLRCAVDSLYLSYKGELSNDVDDRLEDRKKSAQSSDDEEQSIAQITIADRLFSVAGNGAGRFRYVISDDRFRIQISRGKKLPLAYAKISSEYLTYVPIEKIVQELSVIVNSLGLVHDHPKVSRADLCVDFIPGIPMDEFNVRQWVSRARKKAAYWTSGDRFSGWVIGAGGTIQSRTYDKVLEIIEESNKTYLFKVWEALGWSPGKPIWRQEFQAGNSALHELGIVTVSQLLNNQGGLWKYLTEDFLRLSEMGTDSNKSRWKTHPLWTDIQSAIWTRTPQLALERIRPCNLPQDGRIIPGGLGYISSFMAREGITDWGEGLGTFLFFASTYFAQQGITLADQVEGKARLKGCKLNTINNRAKMDAQHAKGCAEAYRKAKDGDDE
jgi:hypothetical protein